jgi:tRNA uridine 5-carboxymethylaminomethyl modification enzyme
LFTSLAEFRLLLRQDNADLRLMDFGAELGLLDASAYAEFQMRRHSLDTELKRLNETRLNPSPGLNSALLGLDSPVLEESITLAALLKRPEIRWEHLAALTDAARPGPQEHRAAAETLPSSVREQAEIQLKYEGYIRRQLQQVEQFKQLETKRLPDDVDYLSFHGLSHEARQKLHQMKPESLGQASRISGVTPADISVLLVGLEARQRILA